MELRNLPVRFPSPIIIDTLGDGFDLTHSSGGVDFDINGIPRTTAFAWTTAGSDDAWFASRPQWHGRIGDGAELFGNFTPQPSSPTPNGFIALAAFISPPTAATAMAGYRIATQSSRRCDCGRTRTTTASVSRASFILWRRSTLWRSSLITGIQDDDRHGNCFLYRAKVYDAQGRIWNDGLDVFLLNQS